MNKKLQKIQNLKSKLYAIQNKLENIQKEDISNATVLFKNSSQMLSPKQINSHKNPSYHSPTFWSGDPILGKQNQYKEYSPPKKNNLRTAQKHNVPWKLQKLVQTIQNDYYQSAPQTTKHQPNLTYQIQKQRNLRQHKFFKCNRQQKNICGILNEKTPRFQKNEKLRTYTSNLSNPILNPDPEKPTGKKIVRKIQRSPENPYTQNPNSDTWMYTSQKRNRIFLSPNRRVNNDRNNSPNIRQVLSSSLQLNQGLKSRSKGKKHFRRYFEENFTCQWV